MSADNKAIVRRLIQEVWNRRDLKVLDDIVAAQYVRHDPSISHRDGNEGFREYVKSIRAAFPDIEFAIEDLIAEGDPMRIARIVSDRSPRSIRFWGSRSGR